MALLRKYTFPVVLAIFFVSYNLLNGVSRIEGFDYRFGSWAAFVLSWQSAYLVWLPALTGYLLAAGPHYRWQRTLAADKRRAYNEAVNECSEWLRRVIPALFPDEELGRVRANISMPREDELEAVIRHDVDAQRGRGLRWKRGCGASGAAWLDAVSTDEPAERRKPIVFRREATTIADMKRRWHLTREQLELTKHIIWVVSVPIFAEPKDASGFIGVLSFDGLRRLRNEDLLESQDFHEEAVTWAEAATVQLRKVGLVPKKPRAPDLLWARIRGLIQRH